MYTESGCLVAYNFFISGYFFSLCRIRFFFYVLYSECYMSILSFLYIFSAHIFFLIVQKLLKYKCLIFKMIISNYCLKRNEISSFSLIFYFKFSVFNEKEEKMRMRC